MKIVVYTCITGDYDDLLVPTTTGDDVRFVCFTDSNEALPAPWQRGEIPRSGLDAKDTNRHIKMFPDLRPELLECDATVYVDGSIQIVGDVSVFVRDVLRHGDAGVWMFDHPVRDCVYEEGHACAASAHASVWTIVWQLAGYRSAGFPRRWGLSEANVILRRPRDATTQRLMERWWALYSSGAKRDQLALPFASWTTGIRVQSLGRSDARFDHRYFRIVPHKARRAPVRHQLRRLVNKTALRVLGKRIVTGHR